LGGGADNDSLDGDAGGDSMFGDAGDDQLFSRLGEGPGAGQTEALDGGSGIDFALIDRSDKSRSYTLDLNDPSLVSALGDGTTIVNVERIEFHAGSGNDRLAGGALDDILTGGAGSDLLDGNAGNDMLNGGAGIDILDGDADNDIIIGGAGADLIDGGDG